MLLVFLAGVAVELQPPSTRARTAKQTIPRRSNEFDMGPAFRQKKQMNNKMMQVVILLFFRNAAATGLPVLNTAGIVRCQAAQSLTQGERAMMQQLPQRNSGQVGALWGAA